MGAEAPPWAGEPGPCSQAGRGPCLPRLTAISLTPLLQWSGLRAGVTCGGADGELALGPPSEFHFLFVPLLYPPGPAGTFQSSVALATWHRYLAPWGVLDAGDWGPMGNMGCGNCDPGVKSQRLSLLAVWPQANCLLVWDLNLPCYKS